MHPVLLTILRRPGLRQVTLLLVSIIIFSSINMLPGDFGQAVMGQAASEDTEAAFRRELGLDQPAVVRYLDWIGDVAHGDLGASFSGRSSSGIDRSRPVIDLIGPRLSNTLFLAALTAVIAVPIALFLGITAALWRNSSYYKGASVATLKTISFREFFVAHILTMFFGTLWPLFRSLADLRPDMGLGERVYASILPAMTLTLVIECT